MSLAEQIRRAFRASQVLISGAGGVRKDGIHFFFFSKKRKEVVGGAVKGKSCRGGALEKVEKAREAKRSEAEQGRGPASAIY